MNTTTKSIFDHSFDYAKTLLEDTRQCYPFGAFVDNSGQVHPLEFDTEGIKNIPDNETVRNSLRTYCETEIAEGRIIAWGLTYEAIVQLEEDSEGTDTIAIDIYSKDEDNIPVYYTPYSLGEGSVDFGETFAVAR